MKPIVLSLEEKVVLRAIIAQRAANTRNIFEYDAIEGQKYLNSIGAFASQQLTATKQWSIIENLAQKGVISMDSIVNAEFINNYRSALGRGEALPEEKGKFFWLHETDWAYSSLQLGGYYSIEEAYKEHGGGVFIKMAPEDLELISQNYLEKHKVYLEVDETNCCIKIKFDKETEWHEFSHLDGSKQQYKILDYAANKKPGKVIKRDELNRGCKITIKKSLKKLFQDNGPVKALVPFLIELSSDSIKIKKSAAVEPETYNELRIKLKIKK